MFQAKGLKPGTAYVFRVRAQNLVGVGKTSAVLGPILAQTRPGESHFYLVLDFLCTTGNKGMASTLTN